MKSLPSPLTAVGLPVRMIDPPRGRASSGPRCLTVRKVPVRLMSIVRRQTSRSRSAMARRGEQLHSGVGDDDIGAHPAASRSAKPAATADSSEMSIVTARAADPRPAPRRSRVPVPVGDHDPRPSATKRVATASRSRARRPSRARSCPKAVPSSFDPIQVQHPREVLVELVVAEDLLPILLMMLSRP